MGKSEITSVVKAQWLDAQKFEGNYWIAQNQRNTYWRIATKFIRPTRHPGIFLDYIRYRDFYCGDDWNYWWMKQFESYKALPKKVERALEVGCGPYTNIRLISKTTQIKEIHCSDPLIDAYTSFKLTWLSAQVRRNRVKISNDRCEQINYDDDYFDLVVCINVLDHVENAEQCLKETMRVIKPGGYIVLGQDLSNEEDLRNREVRDDMGHPIKIHHTTLDATFENAFEPCLKKLLPRGKGRNPKACYGTYIFIGRKK